MTLLLVHRENLAADFYVNGRNIGQFKTSDGSTSFLFLPPYTSYHSLPEAPEDIRQGLLLLDQVPFSTTDKYASAMVITGQENKFYRDGKEITPIAKGCPYDLARISAGLSLMQTQAQPKPEVNAPLTEDEILAAMDYAGEVSNYEAAIAKARASGLNDAQAKLVQKYFVRMVMKFTGRMLK
jgi:hypothetical protein